MTTDPIVPPPASLWAARMSDTALPFVDEGIEAAPAFSHADFEPAENDRVAPFLTPLSVEALATPTQSR